MEVVQNRILDAGLREVPGERLFPDPVRDPSSLGPAHRKSFIEVARIGGDLPDAGRRRGIVARIGS